MTNKAVVIVPYYLMKFSLLFQPHDIYNAPQKPLLVFRFIDTLSDPMINSPLSHLVVISAHARRAIVGPWVAIIEWESERKHIGVRLAHNELPERINAMIEMAVQVFGLGSCIAVELRVMRLPICLSQEVEAMELVEDFDGDSETAFSGRRICDFESVVGVHVHLDHFLSRHHCVRNPISRPVPLRIHIVTLADEGSARNWRKVKVVYLVFDRLI